MAEAWDRRAASGPGLTLGLMHRPVDEGTLRSRPYLVHTNRELGLMLGGAKPLSVFGWIEGYEVDCMMRYLRMFDRHVSAGRFQKQQRTRPVPQLSHVSEFRVFYTLPGQEWRVNAYEDLHDLPGKWTAARERRLGELLGYDDWQNDFHLSQSTFDEAT